MASCVFLPSKDDDFRDAAALCVALGLVYRIEHGSFRRFCRLLSAREFSSVL